jgi:uncharacterized protein YqgC (DUF456 family)
MPHWLEVSIFAITQVIMLVGLFGLLIPLFPGIVVMWLAALGYGVVTGFSSTLGIVLFVIITLLMLAGTLADNVLMGAGARQAGASWLSIGAALAAGVVGTLLVPPIGGLVAAPAAVLLVEYWRSKDWQQAVLALQGLARGWGLSFFARFGIGAVMMVLWWLWVWKG